MLTAGFKALVLPVGLVCAHHHRHERRHRAGEAEPEAAQAEVRDTLAEERHQARLLGRTGLVEFVKTAASSALMIGLGYLAFRRGITHLVNSPAPLEAILIRRPCSRPRTLLLQVAGVGC